MQVGISQEWILETTQGSDDTGMKDNNESFCISTDKEKEEGNVRKHQHWQYQKKNGDENGTIKAKTLMKKRQWMIFSSVLIFQLGQYYFQMKRVNTVKKGSEPFQNKYVLFSVAQRKGEKS